MSQMLVCLPGFEVFGAYWGELKHLTQCCIFLSYTHWNATRPTLLWVIHTVWIVFNLMLIVPPRGPTLEYLYFECPIQRWTQRFFYHSTTEKAFLLRLVCWKWREKRGCLTCGEWYCSPGSAPLGTTCHGNDELNPAASWSPITLWHTTS